MEERTSATPNPTPVDGLVAEIAAVVSGCLGAVGDRIERLVGDADHRTFAAVLVELERLRRGVEAAAVRTVTDVDQRGLHLEDGHRRPANWLRACLRISNAEAAQRASTARLCAAVPAVAAELAAGRLGVAQAADLARVHGNGRVRESFEAEVDELIESAERDDHVRFTTKLREWERLADIDGAHRDAAHDHEHRRAAVDTVGGSTYVDARLGNGQGAKMKEIFDRFCDAEYHADLADLKARTGIEIDHPAASALARTAAQRRADAMFNVFLAAAGAPLEGKPVDVVVNVVVDQQTFEEALADLVDPRHRHRGDVTAGGASESTWHPPAGRARFCTTLDGSALDPLDVALLSLVGHVRRVVVGGDGVIIDLGRRQRLFRGSAREAAILQGALDRQSRCLWPGCGRFQHNQIDHVTEWTGNGATDVANSATMCGHHNVFKTRGYTARRDADGRWHLYRPDGTEIAAA